jgi:DNA-binding NtrC family response regulator
MTRRPSESALEGVHSSPLPVLIIDDQAAVITALQVLFELHDIPYLSAASPEVALRIANSQTLGAVLQDMNFGRSKTCGQQGIELFRALREAQAGVPILLMTAWASLETAVQLVKEGASDYIEKPWDDAKLLSSLRTLLQIRSLQLENERLTAKVRESRRSLEADYELCGIVYESEALHRILSLAVSIAASDAPVLITGPSGSGKEKLAEIIQANSPRRHGPFIRVNVGAIPEELMECELFGAEPGAYTGLDRRRIGHFESADGGTLFLDEIDALSLNGQVKLLRILQSGEFQRLGSSRTMRCNVRVLSATNTDLKEAIASSSFREDLFFRLNVVELQAPGLAERPEDILPLARLFLDKHSPGRGNRSRTLADEAELTLVDHDWPGNVRELENRVHRATLVASGDRITSSDLGLDTETVESANPHPPQVLSGDQFAECKQILRALSRSRGIVAHAARDLGISRQALYRRMHRLGVELERTAKSAIDAP